MEIRINEIIEPGEDGAVCTLRATLYDQNQQGVHSVDMQGDGDTREQRTDLLGGLLDRVVTDLWPLYLGPTDAEIEREIRIRKHLPVDDLKATPSVWKRIGQFVKN
jgi:hypothetical protein